MSEQTMSDSDVARFRSAYVVSDDLGCWEWQRSLDRGYGRFYLNGRTDLAHRVSYEMHNGPIPDGLQIDHLCRNRKCVNPAHLEAVTVAENVLRGVGLSAQNARKTTCKRGHQLSGENLRINADGARVCFTCAKESSKYHYRRRLERMAQEKMTCPWPDCEERPQFTVIRVDPDLGDIVEYVCAFHASYTVEVEGHGSDTDITVTITPKETI